MGSIMSVVDSETIKCEIAEYLPLRDSQLTSHTDSVLLRDKTTGKCGLGSCVYIEWKGLPYAVSCHHVLNANREYFTGAKRLTKPMIEEGDSHAVPPLHLIDSNKTVDLALFDLNGLSLPTIPKQSYSLGENQISLKKTEQNLGTAAFIHGVPGFSARVFQYPDGSVYADIPVYSAWGPIVEVSGEAIVVDFAEREVSELNDKDFPHLKDLKPTGGTRDLGGMSGSGLWVIGGDRFHLAGILLGPAEENQPETQHLIRFTPVWRLIGWLEGLNLHET